MASQFSLLLCCGAPLQHVPDKGPLRRLTRGPGVRVPRGVLIRDADEDLFRGEEVQADRHGPALHRPRHAGQVHRRGNAAGRGRRPPESLEENRTDKVTIAEWKEIANTESQSMRRSVDERDRLRGTA